MFIETLALLLTFNQMVDKLNDMDILNHMVEYNDNEILSELLKAVSDTTRRSLLTRLCQQGPSRVTDIAKVYDMSLNAISKHIKVLEKAELVSRTTIGRTHLIEANLNRIAIVEQWFSGLKSIWALRLDKLNEVLKKGEPDNV